MERVACLLIGYVFGLFQTGYIYGKLHNTDIRKSGSGNLGTTNAYRVMGARAGIIVFLGDAFKAIFACALVRFIFKGNPNLDLLALYTACGVVLGHDFPFYLGFKGGKGVAAIAGTCAAMNWRVALVCGSVFIIFVLITHYVSVASILVVIAFTVMISILTYTGIFTVTAACRPEMCILALCMTLLAIWQHRENIKRLAKGTESKIW